MMKNFLLYGHGGAYNHGAEAITKITIKMIREKYDNANIALASHFPEQDKKYGIDADEFFSPIPEVWEMEKRTNSISEKKRLARKMYCESLNFITPETTCLSVGGDNYCYPNWHRLAVFQEEASRKNAKSILWGCSVDPSAITPEMEKVLSSHTYILTRESHTYRALKACDLLTDLQMFPDPAFLLEPDQTEIPSIFRHNKIVGINISPLVLRKECTPGILVENIRNLIEHILCETNMIVILISHVAMPMDNDYNVLSIIEQSLPAAWRSRVWLVDENFSASQLKFIISRCSFLVCARTHASIAAYSLGIPTLVIGYSVKSVGIAEDLAMSKFLLDAAFIQSPDAIKNKFKQLCMNEPEIRSVLKQKSQQFKLQVKSYADYI